MGGSVTIRIQADTTIYTINYKCMALNNEHLVKPKSSLNSLNPPYITKNLLSSLLGQPVETKEFKPRMLFVNDEGFIRMTHSFQFAEDFHF